MFVIVDSATRCKFTHPKTFVEYYKTERAAKSAITRISKLLANWGREVPSFEVMETAAYRAQVPMITVTNLMTGKPVTIPADQRGSCCDPSTERYWSM